MECQKMKSRFSGLFIFMGVCLMMQHPAFGADKPSPDAFHAPQTEAEKALENILALEGNENNLFKALPEDAVTKRPKNLFATQPFTDKFLDSVREKDRKLKQGSCAWGTGEACGFDANPVLCAQGISDSGYDFFTIKENKNKITITSKWHKATVQDHDDHDPADDELPPDEKPVYQLVKDGDRWKLDGVSCGNDHFNME
jgi:hypothetical protein